MKGNILVDTSVWIEFFRKKEEPLQQTIASLLKEGRCAYTGKIIADHFPLKLYGIRR